jgi:hypothetical protein
MRIDTLAGRVTIRGVTPTPARALDMARRERLCVVVGNGVVLWVCSARVADRLAAAGYTVVG